MSKGAGRQLEAQEEASQIKYAHYGKVYLKVLYQVKPLSQRGGAVLTQEIDEHALSHCYEADTGLSNRNIASTLMSWQKIRDILRPAKRRVP